MIVRELTDPLLPRSIPFRIFLPPCFVEHPDRTYPALYLLHGLTRTDEQWDLLGADETAQELIQAGRLPPFLIIMPWERRGLNWEDAVLRFLIPHVESVYHAAPDPALRAIGGISRGAGWSFRIAFGHLGMFGAVGLHSPAILSPDEFLLPLWLRDSPSQELPRLWIDIGERDSLKRSALELHALLDELGVTHRWSLFPGDHLPEYWEDHLAEYLTWYAEGWEDFSP